MPEPADALVLAERFFAALEAGDVDAVRDLYADDAAVWHNTDGVTQTREENLRTLRWVVRNLRDLRYEVVRREPTPGGFVQQHVLHALAPDGRELTVPACLVVTVEGGRITRLDEYLDSAHIAPLTGG